MSATRLSDSPDSYASSAWVFPAAILAVRRAAPNASAAVSSGLVFVPRLLRVVGFCAVAAPPFLREVGPFAEAAPRFLGVVLWAMGMTSRPFPIFAARLPVLPANPEDRPPDN